MSDVESPQAGPLPPSRRACRLCRQRKARCELPDPSVEPGPNPLTRSKACHRCIVLSRPCILDEATRTRRRRGKRVLAVREDIEDNRPQNAPSLEALDKNLQVVQLWRFDERNVRILKASSEEVSPRPPIMQLDNALHFAMYALRHAHGDHFGTQINIKGDLCASMAYIATQCQTSSLEPMYSQLLAYYPQLPPIADLDTDTPGSALLVAIISYLLHPLLELAQHITLLRNIVMLRSEPSLCGAIALGLLGLHAPLGVLPCQSVGGVQIDVLRGIPIAAKSILPKDATQQTMFDSTQTWARISQCNLELLHLRATEALPENFTAISSLCATFLADESLWRDDPYRLLGKAHLCERILVAGVLDQSTRRTGSLIRDALLGQPNEVPQTLEDDLIDRLEEIEGRADHIIDKLGPAPESWQAYRKIWQCEWHAAIYRVIFRCILTVSCDISSQDSVDSAISHALQPERIIQFFDERSGANRVIRDQAHKTLMARAAHCEQILMAFASIPSTELIPWHSTEALCLAACSTLMETEAGHIRLIANPKHIVRAARSMQWDHFAEMAAKKMESLEASEEETLSKLSAQIVHATLSLSRARREAASKAPMTPVSTDAGASTLESEASTRTSPSQTEFFSQAITALCPSSESRLDLSFADSLVDTSFYDRTDFPSIPFGDQSENPALSVLSWPLVADESWRAAFGP